MINRKMWVAAIALIVFLNSDAQKEAKAATLPSFSSNYLSRFHIGKDTTCFFEQGVPQNVMQFENLSGLSQSQDVSLVLTRTLPDTTSIENFLKAIELNSMPSLMMVGGESFFVEDTYRIFVTILELMEFYLGVDAMENIMNVMTSNNLLQNSESVVTGFNIQGIELNLGLSSDISLSVDEARRMILYGNPKPQQTIIFDEDSSLWYIARDHGLTEEELYLLNPQIKDLKWAELIGMELDVTPINPLIKIESETQEIYTSTIAYQTEYMDDDMMLEGQMEILQKGKNGKVLTRIITSFDGTATIEEENVSEVVNEVIARGTKVVSSVGTGVWTWPTTNHEVTKGYLSDEGYYGIGITANTVQDVYAADSGVVEVAELNVHESVILINHKNGYYSRYGNLSGMNVSIGDEVEAGQTIGMVGIASDEMESNLYFEIRTNNGDRQTYAPNPLDFF